MKRILSIAACSAISTFLANIAIADDSDAAAEVLCSEIAFSHSIENKDQDAFAALVDEDARFVGAAALRGKTNIVEAWSVFFQENGPELIWRPQFIEVLSSGNLALSRGPYRMRSQNENGDIVEEWGTYNSIWRRNDDGDWHIIFDAGDTSAESQEEKLAQLIEDNADECL
jgi:ketosteroid isomerase-like protein